MSPGLGDIFPLPLEAQLSFLIGAMVVLGYFMVSRWRFPSLKALQIRVASFQLVFTTAIGTVLFFYGVIYHFAVAFFVLSWTYVGTACVLSAIRLIAGKKAKVLADFEPEPDSDVE